MAKTKKRKRSKFDERPVQGRHVPLTSDGIPIGRAPGKMTSQQRRVLEARISNVSQNMTTPNMMNTGLAFEVQGPSIPGDPGAGVTAVLSAVVAKAREGRGRITGLALQIRPWSDRHGDHFIDATARTVVEITIECDEFPTIGQSYGYTPEDERGFAELMVEFWAKEVQRLNETTTVDGPKKVQDK